MKKLFAVMMAAATIAMVGCKKDDKSTPDIVKTTPDVEATEGFFTIVWNAYGYSECEPLVFAGNYNDYATGNVDDLIKFEKIEGYENWYVARIDASLLPDKDGNTSCQGKGCALYNGSFNASWNHQWFIKDDKPVELVQGDGELTDDIGENEQKLIINEPGSVTYVRSYGFKQDPCEELVMYDVTFNLHVDQAVPAEAVVNIIGDFPDHSWTAEGVEFLEMQRVDDNNFTITLSCPLYVEYKYVMNAEANRLEGDPWKQEMILIAPEEDATCLPKNSNLKVADVDMPTSIWGFVGVDSDLPWCEDAPVGPTDPVEVHAGDVLEIKVRLAEGMEINQEGLYIWSWGHANQGCTPMTLTEGVWTASITVADEADAEAWGNSGMLFVDANVAEGDAAWGRKSGQTGDIKPIAPGLYELNADWTVTYIPANNEDEPAEEGGEEGGEE